MAQVASGNWSIARRNEFYVAYFVRIAEKQQREKHFQALLKDRFFNIFVESERRFRVEFMEYNFTAEVRNSEDEMFAEAFADVSDSLAVDIFFFSKSHISVSLIDKRSGDIEMWTVRRPISKEITRMEIFKMIGYFSCLIVGIKIMVRYFKRTFRKTKQIKTE